MPLSGRARVLRTLRAPALPTPRANARDGESEPPSQVVTPSAWIAASTSSCSSPFEPTKPFEWEIPSPA